MATSFLAFVQPTQATIDNTATASGTYSGNPVTSAPKTVNIPVVAANPSLSIAKSIGTAATIAAGANATITDSGDTIVYHYIITNNGNVTITGVTPVDAGPKFGTSQVAGTGSMSAFTLTSGSTTLLPGQTAGFNATYTLSTLDVDRAAGQLLAANAVNNSSTGTGTPPTGPAITSPPGTATTLIAAGPLLTVNKSGSITTKAPGNLSANAEKGDTITYTYTVVNTGNVAISGVVINDTHEAALLPQAVFTEALTTEGPLVIPASTDAAVNGSWDVIQPGATVTFTYVHTVTQAEVDGG